MVSISILVISYYFANSILKVGGDFFVDEYGSILRTQKMTAKDVYKLSKGEKVLVHVNDTFQLIKGATTVCTRFMTLLLRQPNLCPPEAKDWREIKARCGVLLLGELRVISSKTLIFYRS